MHGAALGLAITAIAGLLIGAAVPEADTLRGYALYCLFVQTMMAVGALAEPASTPTRQWAWNTLVKHHLVSSLPLMALGGLIGLDHWLGAGVFLLGAVPPAIALPSYAAACNAQVRPIVQFCIVGYAVGILLTPALTFAALGTTGRADSMVVTLLFGLIAPALVGALLARWLRRIPRPASFGVVGGSVLVLMLGMGSALREAMSTALDEPVMLCIAFCVAFGRCAWGSALSVRYAADRNMKVESALAGGGKNAVLAAVIAGSAFSSVAALPALLGLFAEAGLFLVISYLSARQWPHLSGEAH